MAAGSWLVFGEANLDTHNGGIALDTDSLRMVLVTSSYTPNQSTHDTWSDISTNEVAAGGGYSTHGKALTATATRSGLVTTFDCDDQSWTASTITAKYAVIVKDANSDNVLAGTDSVICYVDLDTGGGSVSSSAANFDITIHANGVFQTTAS